MDCMSMSMKVCSPKTNGPPGIYGEPSEVRCSAATSGPKAGGTAPWCNDYLHHQFPRCLPRMSPRNAPSRSKIEAHKTGRDLTPTAPGSHVKGDSCAKLLPVTPGFSGGRGRSQLPDQIRSAGIAGQRNGRGASLEPAGPEGGKSGVRPMEERGLVALSTRNTTCGQSVRRMQ